MENRFITRPARLEDVEELSEHMYAQHLDIFQTEPEGGKGKLTFRAAVEENIRNSKLGKFMLAKDMEREGRTTNVGLFVFEFSFILGGPCIEISGAYTLPEYRGKNVSGLALSQTIDKARSEPGI